MFPPQRCSCSGVSVHLWSQRSSPARLQTHFSGNLNTPREVPRRFHILHLFFEQKILDKISQAPLFLSSLTPPSASIKTCCLSTLSTLCLLFLLSIFLFLFKSLTYHSLLVTSQVSRWYLCTTLIGALEIAGREGRKKKHWKTSDALFDKWQL